MTNKTLDLRLPAEWEDYKAVLLSWPHANTDWAYMLEEVQKTVCEIASEAVAAGLKVVIIAPDTSEPRSRLRDLGDNVLYFNVETNDTWTRDYGVITCKLPDGRSVLCDFKFNGWGLKFASDRDNLVTVNMYGSHLLEGEYVNHLGFVLEGGSIESDGQGTILTTSRCLESLNRNGNLDRDGIERYLSSALGVSRFLWLDYGYLAGDDTDSHIDTLARLVAKDTIVYIKCDDADDEHYEQLKAMENQLKDFVTTDGLPYNLVGLPLPDPIFDEDGYRLPATYANFLITPQAILLPVYGQEKNDFLAIQIMQVVFPDRKIVPVNCNSLIRQHGSLHCMTMQLYDIPL
ncbi:MAG: agmatine deiminase family protein [Muribaculaceae bacterium]|nr:agmatine deiminase family protein [Muribaculaceae bacterium]